MNVLLQRLLRKIAYWAPGGYSLRPSLHKMRGVHIGDGVWISQYVYIDEIHPESISIGNDTTIGIGTLIIAHLYWGPRQRDYVSKVKIGDNVFIGPYCVILPNVTIGNGAVVQAGTVVSKDVPPETLWGIPKAKALARVSIPLTQWNTYKQYIQGLRPLLNDNDTSKSDNAQ
jgi:acetyltransferase-like isoleucine patch superfamily enzyme